MAVTKEALLDYFEKKARVDVSKLQDDTALFSTGLVDSFAMVDLLMFLEKNTGARLGPEDINLDNLDSIEKIMGFAASRAKR